MIWTKNGALERSTCLSPLARGVENNLVTALKLNTENLITLYAGVLITIRTIVLIWIAAHKDDFAN